VAQKVVQLIIGKIITDEELRLCFLDQPTDTLLGLKEKGFELTQTEIDAILQTDTRLWRTGPHWVDPRLQRCRMCPDG